MNDRFFVHPQAIVETETVGERTRIWAFSHILKEARIGSNCNICEHVFIENDVVIGNDVTIKSGVYIWDGIRIADKAFIGPNVAFTNDLYPRSKVYQKVYPKTFVQEGASIGANSVIIAGISVGRYSMIGAGSVLTKEIQDFELVYGNPAQHRGYVCKCTKKLNIEPNEIIVCSCGDKYRFQGGRLCQV